MSSSPFQSSSPQRPAATPVYGATPPASETESAGPWPLHEHPEFRSVASAYRRLGTVSTVVAVGGFLMFVLLSSFAPSAMDQPLVGRLTVGLALGLGQFVLMAVVAWRYTRAMSNRIDPAARQLRARLQQQQRRQDELADKRIRVRGLRTW